MIDKPDELKCDIELCPMNWMGRCDRDYATEKTIQSCKLRVSWNAHQPVSERARDEAAALRDALRKRILACKNTDV